MVPRRIWDKSSTLLRAINTLTCTLRFACQGLHLKIGALKLISEHNPPTLQAIASGWTPHMPMFGLHIFFNFWRRLTNIWLCLLRGVFHQRDTSIWAHILIIYPPINTCLAPFYFTTEQRGNWPPVHLAILSMGIFSWRQWSILKLVFRNTTVLLDPTKISVFTSSIKIHIDIDMLICQYVTDMSHLVL